MLTFWSHFELSSHLGLVAVACEPIPEIHLDL
jgi:hypothetical protein